MKLLKKYLEKNKIAYLASQIQDICILNGITVSTMESMTAGLLSSFLTRHSDASKFFKGGFVLYQLSSKNIILDLEIKSPINKKSAYILAQTTNAKFQSDVCISTTGMAEPHWEKKKIIEPLCYYCIYLNHKGMIKYKKFFVTLKRKDRYKNQTLAAIIGLELLLNFLKEVFK